MVTITKGVLTYESKKILKGGVDVTDNLKKLSQTEQRFKQFIKTTFGSEALEDYIAE